MAATAACSCPFSAFPPLLPTGTLIFARKKNTKSMMIIPTRNDDGSGYTIEIMPPLENFPTEDDEQDLNLVNRELEKAISRKPNNICGFIAALKPAKFR